MFHVDKNKMMLHQKIFFSQKSCYLFPEPRAIENCYSLQRVFCLASLYRRTEVTYYIVSFPLSIMGKDFPKLDAQGKRGI